jgi:hypothetical protein
MATPKTPSWTVMVYFAGQNHLAEEMVYSLKDMKSVGSTKNLTLLAEYSARWVWKKYSTPTELATPLRFQFRSDPTKWVVKDYVQPKSYQREFKHYVDELADFIIWGIRKGKSDHYMLILSGDGGGPVAPFLPLADQPDKKLQPFQIHEVFEKVWAKTRKRIDIVGLDSCLMSTAEIGYELREFTDYLVSSQGNIDDVGWPYRDILTIMKDQPGLAPESVAAMIVDAYNSYYVDYAMISKSSANLSALDLRKFDDLAGAVGKLVEASNRLLPTADDKPKKRMTKNQDLFARALMRAHWLAQTYRSDQYTDVYDFCDKLIEEIELLGSNENPQSYHFGDVIKACEETKAVLSDSVVLKSCHVGARYQYSRGLSVYFPWNRINEKYWPYLRRGRRSGGGYAKHSFAWDTFWGTFLDRYLYATRRSDRPGFVGTPPKYNKFMRDPPEGKGDQGMAESAKNPPLFWHLPECITDPLKNL